MYGAVGGLIFAVITWGLDAISLAQSRVVLPFGKLVPGMAVCVILVGLVGWLTMRIDKTFVAFLLWTLTSVGLVRLVLWLPFDWTAWLTQWLYPNYFPYITYPALVGTSQMVLIGSIGLTILAGIAGLIEILLIDSAMGKQGNGGLVSVLFVISLLMGMGGFLMDGLLNPNFRTSAEGLDNLIQFAVENKDHEVDPIIARQNHLRKITELGEEVYSKPYQMIVQTYDPVMLTQINYIIDFSGELITCTVVESSPIYCRPLFTRNFQPTRRLIAFSQEDWQFQFCSPQFLRFDYNF